MSQQKIQNSTDLQKENLSINSLNAFLKGKVLKYKTGCYAEPTMIKVTNLKNAVKCLSKKTGKACWKDRYCIDGIMVGSSSSDHSKPMKAVKINENYHCNISNFEIVSNTEFEKYKQKVIKSL